MIAALIKVYYIQMDDKRITIKNFPRFPFNESSEDKLTK